MSEELNAGVVSPINVQPTADAVTPVIQDVTVMPQVATASAELDPFEAMFTGSAVMDNVSEHNSITMNDGIAVINKIELATSKGGHPMVVITFGDVTNLGDASKGHIEYISCTDGWRWKSAIERVRYLVEYSNNPNVIAEFNACFATSPFQTIKNNLGQAIQMTDWKQLDALKLQMKDENITAIFFDKKDKITRTAVKFHNPLAFCTALNNAFQGLIGLQYELKLTEDKKSGFQRAKKYLPIAIA